MLITAYDYPTAAIAEEAGIDIILVGDSLGMVVLGDDTTTSVTMEQMLHHCKATTAGAKHSFVIGDMPFGSYQDVPDAVHNAIRFLKEARVSAIKLEGGASVLPQIKAIVDAGIVVVGHLGFTPQTVHALGGVKVQGKDPERAKQLLDDALALQAAGVSMLVLEMVPPDVAATITKSLCIPVIGIGAGGQTSGQILVFHDVVGLTRGHRPKFSKCFSDAGTSMVGALRQYRQEVEGKTFPSIEHFVGVPPAALSNSSATNRTRGSENRTIVVVGGGSLGSWFAGRLALSRPEDRLVLVTNWKQHREAIAGQGLKLNGQHVPNNLLVAAYDQDELEQGVKIGDSADIVLVLNKGRNNKQSAEAAYRFVKKRQQQEATGTITDGGLVVVLQNGVGFEEIYREAVPSSQATLCFGVTSVGAAVPVPGCVQGGDLGTTTSIFFPNKQSDEGHAAAEELVRALAAALTEAGILTEVECDAGRAHQLLWKKLLVNAVINPLAAVFGVVNGELLRRAGYKRAVDRLIEEVSSLPVPDRITPEILKDSVYSVLQATAKNTNSMLNDVHHDRETEFDQISGQLLDIAFQHKHPMPITNSLSTLFAAMLPQQPAKRHDLVVADTIDECRRLRHTFDKAEIVGFIPTMGGLHEGHLSLFRKARETCDRVVGSIFVNPLQFAAHEDLDRYPRTIETDLQMLREEKLADMVFLPSPRELYPKQQDLFVVPIHIDNVSFEARDRPHFFRGVATVVAKLMNIVQPHKAFFGQKDAVQVVCIRNMLEQLCFPIDLVVVDTAREADGLAMSTRNQYLSPEERMIAPCIHAGLQRVQHIVASASRPPTIGDLRALLEESLNHPGITKGYVSFADADNLEELGDDVVPISTVLCSVAVTIGKTRLIDNILIC